MRKPQGIMRILKACLYSRDGLRDTWRTEAAFRQEIMLAMILIPAAFFMARDRVSLALMIASVLLVLIVEVINSAIEAVVDRHGEERHPLAKKAKDAGSAAVLLALLNMVCVWCILLI